MEQEVVALGREQEKDSDAAGSCPCRVSDFQVPDEYGATHKGGPHLIEVAKASDVPGLLFLSYHMASDLDGKISRRARSLGASIPRRGKIYDEMHAAFLNVKNNYPNLRHCFVAYCLLLTVALPALFIWWLVKPNIVVGIGAATVFELYFLNIFHTRHHRNGQLYQSKLLSELTTPMYDFVEATWGYTVPAWRINHNVKHHVHTNDNGIDTDVPAMYPYVRSCYDTERFWFHKFQTFYWPLLALGAAVQFPVNNLIVHNGKLFHFICWTVFLFVLPVSLHGWDALLQSLLMNAWAGGSLAYKFAVSHTHSALEPHMDSKDACEDIDEWLQSQIERTISWGGYFIAFVFGGINMQIEHHICPALDPPLYALVAPQIKCICRKHGVKYTAEPTFFHAAWQFHKHLWQLGLSSKQSGKPVSTEVAC